MAPATQNKEKGTVTAKAGAKATKQAKGQPESLVYVGPNLAGDLRLSQFTVYRGLPAEVKAATKEDPVLARCFVPVTKLAQARKDLAKEASPMAKAFGQVFKKYRPGVSRAHLPGRDK